MAEFDHYDHGQFCWVELVSGNVAAARDFYTGLFGWDAEEDPLPSGNVYVMFRLRGRRVAAAYGLGGDERAAGVEPHWRSYVSVDDADRVAKAAEEAGGRVSTPPHDMLDIGRAAAIVDPTGAEVRLWQPGRSHGAELADEPGSFCWNELITNDLERAAAFYGEVFGWTTSEDAMSESRTYTTFLNGTNPNAGMMLPPDVAPDLPPQWNVYFNVEDAAATAERATQLGGHIHLPPTRNEGWGTVAAIADVDDTTIVAWQREPDQG
jgi:uncharacterized protein